MSTGLGKQKREWGNTWKGNRISVGLKSLAVEAASSHREPRRIASLLSKALVVECPFTSISCSPHQDSSLLSGRKFSPAAPLFAPRGQQRHPWPSSPALGLPGLWGQQTGCEWLLGIGMWQMLLKETKAMRKVREQERTSIYVLSLAPSVISPLSRFQWTVCPGSLQRL